MRVLVTGGRDYPARDYVFHMLDQLHAVREITVIIHGACCVKGCPEALTGADRWAQEWAQTRQIPYCGMPARWLAEGKGAGPIRNGRMLEKWKPEIVLAFPGGRGTADMIARANDACITVLRAEPVSAAAAQP